MGVRGTRFSHPPSDIPGGIDQPSGEDAGQSSIFAAREAAGESRPYPPSWVDRLTDRVRGLPVPAWAFYLAVGGCLLLGYMVLLLSSDAWANGTLTMGSILIYSFLNGTTLPFLLALIHYLDDSAEEALIRFRPVMTVDEAGYNKLRYQLTTLPPRATLIASGLGVVYTFAVLLTNIATMGIESTEARSPGIIVLVWGLNLLTYTMVTTVVYHTLHQLRTVNLIYTKYTRINLFQLGPLYDLSGLTARTAIGLGIPTYLWFQANSLSAMGTTASDIIQTGFLSILVLITFISPLWGAHGLLEREKSRLQDEVAQRIEATITDLHSQVDNRDLKDRAALKDTLDSLVTEQGVIHKLRTWPWRTETVSGLGLAFLLPIIIWVVQRVLARFGL